MKLTARGWNPALKEARRNIFELSYTAPDLTAI